MNKNPLDRRVSSISEITKFDRKTEPFEFMKLCSIVLQIIYNTIIIPFTRRIN